MTDVDVSSEVLISWTLYIDSYIPHRIMRAVTNQHAISMAILPENIICENIVLTWSEALQMSLQLQRLRESLRKLGPVPL